VAAAAAAEFARVTSAPAAGPAGQLLTPRAPVTGPTGQLPVQGAPQSIKSSQDAAAAAATAEVTRVTSAPAAGSINQSVKGPHKATHEQGEATSDYSHRAQQTLRHEAPQARGAKNESAGQLPAQGAPQSIKSSQSHTQRATRFSGVVRRYTTSRSSSQQTLPPPLHPWPLYVPVTQRVLFLWPGGASSKSRGGYEPRVGKVPPTEVQLASARHGSPPPVSSKSRGGHEPRLGKVPPAEVQLASSHRRRATLLRSLFSKSEVVLRVVV